MSLLDVLRVVCLVSWAVNIVITFAVVLTYNEARQRTPGAIRLLLRHVVLVGISHLTALSALAYLVYDRLGREDVSWLLPVALLSNLTSNAALALVLGYQKRRREAQQEEVLDA